MAYTAPTVRTTGELITASIWNTDLVADIIYLKAQVDAPSNGILSVSIGGSRESGEFGTSVRSGATADKLLWGSRIFTWPSGLTGITAKFDAMLKIESAGATATLAIYNLTDGAPDTAVVSVTSTSTTGQLKTSASFSPIVAKDYGFKLHSNHASLQAWAWAIALYPAG
jgi:hypothetical protein